MTRRWLRGSCLALTVFGVQTVACSAGNSETAAENDDAFSAASTFWDRLEAKVEAIGDAAGGDWKTPAPNNRWSQNFAPTQVGQENVLPDEPQTFAKIASDIQGIQQKLLASNNGTIARAFHAKAHACVQGKLYMHVPDTIVSDANLPADTDLAALKVGLLAETVPHDVWVRWSNGVGGRNRPDGEVDVRGLALKVLDVDGDRLPDGPTYFKQEVGTQDFLMTNGATTPAPTSESFAGFGVSQANMAGASSLGEKASALGGFFDYLVANPRVAATLARKVLPSTKDHNSVLSQRFFSGGAIALGLNDDGTPREAIKFSAVQGRWTGTDDGQGTCTPVSDSAQALKDFVLPGGDANTLLGGDPNYLSTGKLGVKPFLQAGQVCIDLQIQFQRHDAAMLAAQNQPIEDTSVEWLESDSPWVSVATAVLPQLDDPSQDEAECNDLSWNPWHSLTVHRPLGNIMRVRQEVLAASATARGANLVK